MSLALPRSLDEVCAALAARPDSLLLAGGTDLMVAVNAGRHPLGEVISLDRVDELRSWRVEGDQVVLGAGVTHAELAGEALGRLVPVLAQAARTVGSPQIRNAGTLGGNLGTASPAGDLLPGLAALDAVIGLCSAGGHRQVSLADFCVGPKRSARRPDEVIEWVRVPVQAGPQEFLKVGTRNAMVISVASVAVVADVPGRSLRVGLGSVGPTPLRAPEAEAHAAAHLDWADSSPGSLAWSEAADVAEVRARFGQLVASAARPIDDHRSTAAYRRHCAGVLARRALQRMTSAGPETTS